MKRIIVKPLLFGAAALAIAGLAGTYTPSIEPAAAQAPSLASAEAGTGTKQLVINGNGYIAGATAELKITHKVSGKIAHGRQIKTDGSGRFEAVAGLRDGKYQISLGIAGDPDSFGPPIDIQILANDDNQMRFNGELQILEIDWTYRQPR